MTLEEKEAIIIKLKRTIIELPSENNVYPNYNQDDIYRIIPHRPPFNFIQGIKAINLESQSIEAFCQVNLDDPVFKGHFPDAPVYPGVFQIEAMGQAGLCIGYFVKNATTVIELHHISNIGLFTRVHNAGFLRMIKPGDQLRIRAQLVESDEFIGIVAAQVLIGDEICSHSILEVYYQ